MLKKVAWCLGATLAISASANVWLLVRSSSAREKHSHAVSALREQLSTCLAAVRLPPATASVQPGKTRASAGGLRPVLVASPEAIADYATPEPLRLAPPTSLAHASGPTPVAAGGSGFKRPEEALKGLALESFKQDMAHCEKGDAAACLLAGNVFEREPGLDPSQALSLFEKSCQLGDAIGCNRVGTWNEEGRPYHPQDLPAAIAAYKQACDHAGRYCFNLARALEKSGGPEEMEKAIATYRQCCSASDGYCCARLGSLYEFGSKVQKDVEGALAWYDAACSLADKISCHVLADTYALGRGVPPDAERSVAYRKRACAVGYFEDCPR